MPNLEKKSQPPKSEIREFWEWCGFKYEDCYPDGKGNWMNVTRPDGKVECHLKLSLRSFPPIDLNNLFKIAVPKLHTKLGDKPTFDLLVGWVEDIIYDNDPALSLFWAVYPILKEEK